MTARPMKATNSRRLIRFLSWFFIRIASGNVVHDFVDICFILFQLGRDAALVHGEDAVAYPQDLLKLGGDEDDSLAALSELADRIENLFLRAYVYAPGGFVEDEDIAVGAEPFRQYDLLLVAAAQV